MKSPDYNNYRLRIVCVASATIAASRTLTASSAFVKNTVSALLRPVSLLNHRKNGGFSLVQNSSMHAGILSMR